MIWYFISLSLVFGFMFYLHNSSKGYYVMKEPSAILSFFAWVGSLSFSILSIYIFIKIKWRHPFVIFI